MTLFTENLPLIVVVNKGLPNEKKYQGVFRQIISSAITIFLPADQKEIPLNKPVNVIFYIKQLMFEFQTSILQFENQILIVDKPQKIEQNKQRIAKRLHINIPADFTIWTQVGNFRGEIINISAVGCRLVSDIPMKENELISMVWKLNAPDASYDFSCQGLVVWCRDYGNKRFVNGIKFTTLDENGENLIDRIVENYEAQTRTGGVANEQEKFLKTVESADEKSLHFRFQKALEKIFEKDLVAAEKLFLDICEEKGQKDPFAMQEKSFLELQKIYLVQRRFVEAIKTGAKFLERFSDSDNVKSIIFHIAAAYEGMGNLGKAIDYYDKVEKLLPFEKINETAHEKIKVLSTEF